MAIPYVLTRAARAGCGTLAVTAAAPAVLRVSTVRAVLVSKDKGPVLALLLGLAKSLAVFVLAISVRGLVSPSERDS